MKLVINYDLIDAIKNVKEPYGVLKVVRNNRHGYIARMPLWGLFDYVYFRDIQNTLAALMFQYMLIMGSDMLIDKSMGIDYYATMSTKNLKTLIAELETINVMTNYNLLLQARLYDKAYKFTFNKDKTPIIMQEKYIDVPSYNYDGNLKDTSILQEHMIGSSSYVLSVGEPIKKYSRVLVRT